MLMSLVDPGMPKKACQIQRSYEATASNTIDGSFSFPWYCPAHAAGQFFQGQCIQSRDPIIPGNPLASPTCNNLEISSAVGDLRYSSAKTATTPSQKRL